MLFAFDLGRILDWGSRALLRSHAGNDRLAKHRVRSLPRSLAGLERLEPRVLLSSVTGVYAPPPDRAPAVLAVVSDAESLSQSPAAVDSNATGATVVGRHLFYNNSAFDNEAMGFDDDDAIASDSALLPDPALAKAALLPRQKATVRNFTSYSRGINGIMVDIDQAANSAALNAADFEFRVGNDNSPDGWDLLAGGAEISVRLGAGFGGSDRVTIIFSDGLIKNQWLRVVVKATANTGLVNSDVFYWGNAVGDTGDDGSGVNAYAVVDLVDLFGVRAHTGLSGVSAEANNLYDLNRDRAINVFDVTIARDNNTSGGGALKLITAPSEVSVVAALVNDTASIGIANGDGITSDASIAGTVVRHDQVSVLRLGLDGSFVVMTDKLQVDGHFLFDQTLLESTFNGVEDGPHVITVAAEDEFGNVLAAAFVSFTFDTIAPSIVDTTAAFNLKWVEVAFSESVDANTISTAHFQLRGSDGVVVNPLAIERLGDDHRVRLKYPAQDKGTYQLVVHAADLADRAGNVVGGQNIVTPWVVQSIPLFAGLAAEVGQLPRSVAVGDFNGDGLEDLVTANDQSGTVSVLLGNADGGFAARNDYAVGAAPSSVATADLNGDGFVDVVVANRGSDTVSVLLGSGNGSFGDAVNFAVGRLPSAVLVTDLDADGATDLVTADSGSDTVSVLLGTGDGQFAARNPFAVGELPRGIAVADLDGDGAGDLVTVNGGSGTVSVLLGNGDGSFAPASDSAVGENPFSITVADFDNDGLADVVTTNRDANTVSVLLGNGEGGFVRREDFGVGDSPLAVTVADLDGDGSIDLLTSNMDGDTVSVLLGNGDGGFAGHNEFVVGDAPSSVVVADFDDDTVVDLVTTNVVSNTVTVSLGNGDGSFVVRRDLVVPAGPSAVSVADLDGDGIADLATANVVSNTVSVLLGNGDGSFTTPDKFAVGNFPSAVSIADVNGDGFADLVTSNYRSDTVTVLLGDGEGNFASRSDFVVDTAPSSVSVADFNGDGFADLATANGDFFSTSNTVSVLLSDGEGGFAEHRDFAVGNRPSALVAADIDADGLIDLVTANDGSSTVSVLLGNGDGSFAVRSDFEVGTSPVSVVVADLDGDGLADLVTANRDADTVSVLRGVGDGSFAAGVAWEVGLRPVSVSVADLDDDGRPDLVTANVNSDTVSVLLGSGDGGFVLRSEFTVGSSPTAVRIADLDKDGFADLITTNGGSTVSVLLNQIGSAVAG